MPSEPSVFHMAQVHLGLSPAIESNLAQPRQIVNITQGVLSAPPTLRAARYPKIHLPTVNLEVSCCHSRLNRRWSCSYKAQINNFFHAIKWSPLECRKVIGFALLPPYYEHDWLTNKLTTLFDKIRKPKPIPTCSNAFFDVIKRVFSLSFDWLVS